MELADIAIAALGGAAVGFERQHSGHAVGPGASFGGLRTFTLLGVIAGVAGVLAGRGMTALAAILVSAAVAIIVVGYLMKSGEQIDATTEVAALVVVAAGTLAGLRQTLLASAVIALTTMLLFEKRRLHAFARRADRVALLASTRFAVLALVVLPLLPPDGYGPFAAVRPRELWMFVLFFSGLNFCAWLTRRWLGATAGTMATGLLGGLISSTSVTVVLARASQIHAGHGALASAAVGASSVMLARVMAAAALLDPALGLVFARSAAPMLMLGAIATWFLLPRTARQPKLVAIASQDSPLQLKAALQMTGSFALVMIGIEAALRWYGSGVLMVTSALVGATDIDALTLSLARRDPPLQVDLAATALLAGTVANTALKLAIAILVGRGRFRVVVSLSLGAVALAGAAALLNTVAIAAR